MSGLQPARFINATMVDVNVEMDTVVFSNDTLKCTVRLTNNSDIEHVVAWCSVHVHCNCVFSQSRLELFEAPSQKHIPTMQPNAFTPTRGERGHCVYETEAVVLCCDLTLKPADTKAFTYEALLPVRAPPSYKGENIAYFHKLAIGVQRVGNPAELLRIPLRVLPIDPQLLMACRRESAIHAARSAGRLESAIGRPSLSDDSIEFDTNDVVTPNTVRSMRSSPEVVYQSSAADIKIEMQYDRSQGLDVPGTPAALPEDGADGTDAGDAVPVFAPVTPTSASAVRFNYPEDGRRDSALLGPRDSSVAQMKNPFLPPDNVSLLSRDHVLHAITSLSRRRKPSVFKISTSNSKETVAKFYLSKPVFRIGEDVVGWLDFSSSTVSCFQVSITLETEEDIDERYWKKPKEKTLVKIPQAHQKEFCRDLLNVPIMLPVSVASSPQFTTEHVKVQWRMSFEFLMEAKPGSMSKTVVKNSTDKIFATPTDVEVDSLNWSLPITVLPTNPVNLPANQRLNPQLFPVHNSPKTP